MAYALRWQPYYKNWVFTTLAGLNLRHQGQQPPVPTAVCVHGVRVQSSSPGFVGTDPLAISNITGTRSPATNVARSNLESGTQVDEMFTKIYSIYAAHISSEIRNMTSIRGASISTAASEGRYLFSPLQGPFPTEQCPDAADLLDAQLKTVPCLTLDDGDTRKLVSLVDLETMGGFWTTEGSAYRSAEDLMRRIRTGVSIAKLANFIGTEDLTPKESIVGGYAENTIVREVVLGSFEVDQIEILKAKRQVNLHWRNKGNVPLWSGLVPQNIQADQRVGQLIQQFGSQGRLTFPRYRALVLQNSDELAISGFDEEVGVKGSARTYIFKRNLLHQILQRSVISLDQGEIDPANYAFLLIAVNRLLSNDWMTLEEDRLRTAEVLRQVMSQHLNQEITFSDELRALIATSSIRIFDPMWGERSLLAGVNPAGVD